MPFSKRTFGVSLKHSSALFKKRANARRINLTLNLFCAIICSFSSFSNERNRLARKGRFPRLCAGVFLYNLFLNFYPYLFKIALFYLADIICHSLNVKNPYLSQKCYL